LARELTALATGQGCAVEWVAASAASAAVPFGAVAHLWPEGDREPASRLAALRAIAGELSRRADGRRLVLGVDDAHLLDECSLAVVCHLASSGSAFLVLTVRAGQRVPRPLVGLWKDGLALRVDLQALSRPETVELVCSVLGGAVEQRTLQRVWEASEGNPLFLRELLLLGVSRGVLGADAGIWRWRGELSPGERLVELVGEQLGDVEGDVAGLLEVLAVGEPLPLGVVARLAERAVVEEAFARGLLAAEPGAAGGWGTLGTGVPSGRSELAGDSVARGRGTGAGVSVRLAHPLYGEVLRARLSPLRRADAARCLADAAAVGGFEAATGVARVAAWRLEGGGRVSVDVLVSAAKCALAGFDAAGAERLARAAVAADADVEGMLVLARSLRAQGRWQDALEILDEAAAVATGAALAAVAHQQAVVLFHGLDRGEQADRALRAAERAVSDPSLRAELAIDRAELALFRGQPAQAVELADAVIGRAGASDSVGVRAATVIAPALVEAGSPDRALAVVDAQLPVALRLREELPAAPGQLLIGRCYALWMSGRLEEMRQLTETMIGACLERHDSEGAAICELFAGRVAMMRGELRDAARRLREASGLLREADPAHYLQWSLSALAQAYAQSGELEQAAAAITQAQACVGEGGRLFEDELGLARAWLAAGRGELSRAQSLAGETASKMAARGQKSAELFALHDLVRLGAPALATPRLGELAGAFEGVLAPALAAHGAALAAADGAALEQAAATFAGLGYPLLAAEASAEAASAYRRAGWPLDAGLAAARCQQWLQACEAPVTPALALAGRPPSVDELTAREREIAALAARGQSTPQIAQTLVVSQRTVSNHLYHLYAKLGISSRDQLAALLAKEPERGAQDE